MQRIVIVGGGITGCATASELSREGHRVLLFEKSRIAAMASGWTLGGVRQSGRDPAELPLATAAIDVWQGLHERLEADVEYRRGGNLRLARTPAEVDVIRTMVEQQRALGLQLSFLPDNASIRAIAPAISRDVLAASLCAGDGHANPSKTTRAFADDARRHGAEIREGMGRSIGVQALRIQSGRIVGVELDDGSVVDADCVVVAAGINTPRLLKTAGIELPLSIQLVHVVQTEPLPPVLQQVFGVANADCAGRQEADGRLRFTSGIETWTSDPDHWTESTLAPGDENVRRVVDRVASVLPIVKTVRVHRSWGGLIDLTPDALPVIDAPLPGLVVAAGFSGHGFCLGPVSGQLCTDLALGREPRHALGAFRLNRFDRITTTSATTSEGATASSITSTISSADLTLHG